MKRLNFEKCSFAECLNVFNHYASVLSNASKVRLLTSEELDFLSLKPCLDCGIISKFDFRRGLISYLWK